VAQNGEDDPSAEWIDTALVFSLYPRFGHKLSLLAKHRYYTSNPQTGLVQKPLIFSTEAA
jgi:hypothetical protein